jgi:RNA polymerase sigma-70 factor (ECF subfamily)
MTADVSSFETFYDRAHQRVRAALTVTVGELDLAADATDEAFARAYLHWARVSVMVAPEAWVVKVALNVARRQARRRAMEHMLLRRAAVRHRELPAPAGEVWLLVRDLPERQRLAVVLRYVGDLTEEQIATVMGVTRGSASATLAAARQRLGAAVSDPSDPSEETHRV